MKLLIENNKIVGTATDEYSGPMQFITVPDDYSLDMIRYNSETNTDKYRLEV